MKRLLLLFFFVASIAKADKSVLTATPQTGSGGTHTVSLTCTTSPTIGVTGYNFYRTVTSGTGYNKLTASPVSSCSYTDTTVLGSTTYFYVATAICPTCSPSESAFSNEATAVVPPNPQPQPPTGLSVTSVAKNTNADGTTTLSASYEDVPKVTTNYQLAQVYPYRVVKRGSIVNSTGFYLVSWTGAPFTGQGYVNVCDTTGKCVSRYVK